MSVKLSRRADGCAADMHFSVQKPNYIDYIAGTLFLGVGFLGLLATAICASVIKPSDLSNVNLNTFDIAAGGSALSLAAFVLGIILRKEPIKEENSVKYHVPSFKDSVDKLDAAKAIMNDLGGG